MNTDAFATFKHLATINSHAKSRDCLYTEKGPRNVRCRNPPRPSTVPCPPITSRFHESSCEYHGKIGGPISFVCFAGCARREGRR